MTNSAKKDIATNEELSEFYGHTEDNPLSYTELSNGLKVIETHSGSWVKRPGDDKWIWEGYEDD